MKKIIGIFVIALLTTLMVNAQPSQRKGQKGMDLTPDQKATLQVKQMTLDLDLNTGQQTAIYNLMKENAVESQNSKKIMKQKKQDGVEMSNDEKFEMQKQRLDNQIANKAAMKNILNKEQFEKWEKTRKQNKKQGTQHNRTAQNRKNNEMQNGKSQNQKSKYKN